MSEALRLQSEIENLAYVAGDLRRRKRNGATAGRFTSDLSQFTPDLNQFTSDLNQFTSDLNQFSPDLNQFT